MTVEPWWWRGEGVSHPLQLTTGLVVNSFVMASPTLAGERMLLIPKVSILSEQTRKYVVVLGDLNARVGDGEVEGVLGKYGVPGGNESGARVSSRK